MMTVNVKGVIVVSFGVPLYAMAYINPGTAGTGLTDNAFRF
jgi:hypothetical protein